MLIILKTFVAAKIIIIMSNVIGIDLGGTNIKGGLVKDGKLVKSVSKPTLADIGGDTTLDALKSVISELADTDTISIGLGVPSVVDRADGVAYDFSNIRGWEEMPLVSMMQEAFGLPVYMDNDANCFALSESCFGLGRDYSEFVGITLGTGVGGGIIQNHKLLRDANCGSGEYGLMPFRDSILEDYCASRFFTRKYGLSGGELSAKARQGDALALKAFEEYGRNLGELVKIIMYTVDPQAVIFGGAIAGSFDLFISGLKSSLTDFAYRRSVERIQIMASGSRDSGIMGAAALCLETNHN